MENGEWKMICADEFNFPFPIFNSQFSIINCLPLLDEIVPPQVQGHPDDDVDHEQQGAVDVGHQQDVDQAEEAGHRHQADHGTTGRQADGKQLMMDVILVGLEGVAAIAQAVEHHPDDVERRQQQGAEGDEEGVVRRDDHRRGILAILDGQETEGIAQRQAARIAHEDLAGAVGIAENVVIEEGNEDAEGGGRKHGIAPQPFLDEQAGENEQGYPAQTGRQSVDTIDEVDGIGDEHHRENSKGNGDEVRQLMDAQQTVEVVDAQAGQREQAGTEDLYQELLAIADTDQVVGDAYQVEHGHAANEEEHLGKEMLRIRRCKRVTAQQTYGKHQGVGEEDRRKERHTAQARNGLRVYFPLIGNIEQPLPDGDQENARNDHPCTQGCQQKCCKNV